MSDLRNNDTLAKLREKLLVKPENGSADFKKFEPEEAMVSINDSRLTLYVPFDFAQFLCSRNSRPSIKQNGGKIFLIRESLNGENKRRIGSKVEGTEIVAFAFGYSYKPEIKAIIGNMLCSKSAVAVEQISAHVWHIHLNPSDLLRPCKYHKSVGGAPGRVIKGAIEVVQEEASEPQAAECTDIFVASVPAQPEPPEQVAEGHVFPAEAIRQMIKDINAAKQAIGCDLVFRIGEDGLIHATLHLI